jgi:hypothetical protein
VVFAESSHWDPDWLFTSEEYYRLRIHHILNRVLQELLKDPLRVFSIESIFFLKMYWDRNPGKQATVRELANEGRIRFSGCGFTQPDTMIPSTESIIRDFLIGRQWLRENGFNVEPRIAYMTDDFGLSPSFPSILASLGIKYAAASRVDGHYFVGADYALPSAYPLPGSSAEMLLEKLGTTDIAWQAPDGSEVLFHLNLKDYNYGGMISMRGIARWMDVMAGLPTRSERHVAGFISRLVRAGSPYRRTPYIFCPIGGDFNSPIRGLSWLLDCYNRVRYPQTGIYVSLAALEDYMDLVSCHRDELPAIPFDPNPNFMGFYFSRPKLKAGCRKLADDLVIAEKLAFHLGEATGSQAERLAQAWEKAVVTNHHDFVTGTSPQRVYDKEQIPWVREASEEVTSVLAGLRACAVIPPRSVEAPRFERNGPLARIESTHYTIELDEESGGCMTSFTDAASGRELLAGCGNDLCLYEDSGGLWRMGCEFTGGRFRELARSSHSPAFLTAAETNGILQVTVKSVIGTSRVIRLMWFATGAPLIWMRTIASPGGHRTMTCCFRTAFRPTAISMDVTGGVAERQPSKTFEPTFWSAQSFAHVRDREEGPGLALFTAIPAAVGALGTGMEWIVARNAGKERAFGLLPIPAFPARGDESYLHSTTR